MEILILICVSLACVALGFFIGSGIGYNYAMGLALERQKAVLNVVTTETAQGSFLFHDMATNRFLTQSNSIDSGKEDICARFPERLILICTSTNNEQPV